MPIPSPFPEIYGLPQGPARRWCWVGSTTFSWKVNLFLAKGSCLNL
uniref:Macaca fascicularis brain cDNA clone: QmoA-12309, similar to human ELAV (embryonic lethal, abnormal vision,Drosophila)-like 1 (Hu antigen R) (ELAVL1), mRNA, RefSeq: NM_001419.2 n=1 Tax=Macaca fascicularis TaxID=9541 RepID=I7GED2_MACFA|nr:unnamed protein product [Macaca fascicularis]